MIYIYIYIYIWFLAAGVKWHDDRDVSMYECDDDDDDFIS